jgi:hypothetical protein
MAKSKKAKSTADDVRRLTEQAQRQPGLSDLMTLLRQVQDADRAMQDMAPSSPHVLGQTIGHTY